MNILQLQDDLKNFSEEQLINEMRRPSGTAPQYLVLSEINRRQRVKSDYQAAQASDPSTVAEEAVASAGVPASGIMGMAQAMAPKSESSLSAPKPPAMMMREGGVINAQQGTYFPSTPELYGIFGQESSFGKELKGSSGEIGPYQIMPTTALMPGYESYGMLRLFPEISAQIGKGKKYETAEQAYADNKEKIDSVLMSGEKTEPFVKSYLDAAEKKLGSRDLALLAYNQGIAGTEGFKGNPLDTDYVSGVKSNIPMYDERAIKPNLLTKMLTSTGVASTNDNIVKKEPFNKDLETTVLNQIKSTKNPMEIRGIAQLYYGKSTAEINKALEEAGFNPKVIAGTSELGDVFPDFTSGLTLGNKTVVASPELEYGVSAEEMGDKSAITPQLLSMLSKEEQRFLKTPSASLKKQPNLITEEALTKAEEEAGKPTYQTQAEILEDELAFYDPTQAGKSPKDKKKLPTDEKKLPTLDEQLVAMQQDLAKSREQDKYLALAQAGLAIMASDKPTLGQAIGEGAGVGLQAYRDAQERYQEGVVDLLNARAKLAKNKNTFGTKDILTRISAIDGDISKERENLNKRMMDNPTDKEGIQSIKDKIMKLTNLRDRLSVLGGFEPFEISSEARKKLIAGN